MEKELIKLKGTADGVKIYLDSECEFSKLMNSLYEKIKTVQKVFPAADVVIYMLSAGNFQRVIKCVLTRLLRLCCRNVR